MATIIEAVYEDGVLRPIETQNLKEHRRYRLIAEELDPSEPSADPARAAELERRTSLLPDGRRILRLGGVLAQQAMPVSADADPIAETLTELRRERATHFEAELAENFPMESATVNPDVSTTPAAASKPTSSTG